MGKQDPRVDAYIAKSAPFARPVLTHLRNVVHAGCPEVEETFKWSFPHFVHHGILCSMASFKGHCAFGFWKGSLLGIGTDAKGEEAMGQFGRITSLADLPSEKRLIGLVKKAAALNEQGVRKPAPAKPRVTRALKVPADLAAALRKSTKAQETFDAFSPSNKRDYVEWIAEARGAATRARRLATAIEWMAEGKVRNWKYVRK
jgi:uncharacterized protein YdeI (YjbR/CyaY-like superfamily)